MKAKLIKIIIIIKDKNIIIIMKINMPNNIVQKIIMGITIKIIEKKKEMKLKMKKEMDILKDYIGKIDSILF